MEMESVREPRGGLAESREAREGDGRRDETRESCDDRPVGSDDRPVGSDVRPDERTVGSDVRPDERTVGTERRDETRPSGRDLVKARWADLSDSEESFGKSHSEDWKRVTRRGPPKRM